MKTYKPQIIFAIIFFASLKGYAQHKNLIEINDIDLFWNVYDEAVTITDSAAAVQLTQHEYSTRVPGHLCYQKLLV